ncbi:hypothetical protein FV228_00155 [Methylobacterium sp. WL18]|uniref:hypothetical protein n=1 Tax=Methylobacterium sp. WL18 TaxID=2603897 RepID=UPI0011C8B032|nr:hypothetical protein [Methylobacterium sp. WL18]TXN76601.1 hypothetical protein FV228_00155 [Methylobacterium sp. WL18]
MTAPAARWITIDGRHAVLRAQWLPLFPDDFRLPDGVRFKPAGRYENAPYGGCGCAWEIKDGKLYLTSLHIDVIVDHILREFYIEMEDVWGSNEPVLAEWITTRFEVAIGKPTFYDTFEGAVFETYDDIVIEKGIVVERSVITEEERFNRIMGRSKASRVATGKDG